MKTARHEEGAMAFVQTIEIRTDDVTRVRDHLARWDAEQKGIAPGYQQARLLADEDDADRYLIVVDFSSKEEAAANNERPETAAWAAKLRELVAGEPTFTNYRVATATKR
jgi:quinol monooxygenase YgiN